LTFTEFQDVMNYFLELKRSFDEHDTNHDQKMNRYLPSCPGQPSLQLSVFHP